MKEYKTKPPKPTRAQLIGFVVMLLGSYIVLPAAIEWNGYLQTDNRLLTKDWSFSYQEYRLSLQTDYKPNDNIHFYSEIWIRSFGFSNLSTSLDLTDKQKIVAGGLDFREGYLDLNQLFCKNLDLRIGRQRIAWGVADKLNPTDNINPNDLEDIWDFGRHLASNSIKVTYYFNKSSLTGVFIPTFTPAVLPNRDWLKALMPSLSLPACFSYRTITDTIIMPIRNLKQGASYGTKISSTVFHYDFSFSYVYTRYGLPLLHRIVFIPTAHLGEVDLINQLIFPRTHIIGFDIVGAIKDVGVWTEAAMYVPEKTFFTTDLSLLGMGSQDTIILDNKPYIRSIIGLDYTFKNGIYINGQYLHGFVFERGNGNLEDYFTFGMEWKFLQDKLKLNPLNSAIEVKKWQEIKDNYAIVLSPELSYYPFSGTELTVGYRWLDGKLTTTFGLLKDNDELYLKMKYSF